MYFFNELTAYFHSLPKRLL